LSRHERRYGYDRDQNKISAAEIAAEVRAKRRDEYYRGANLL
jgi:hypothetical protein